MVSGGKTSVCLQKACYSSGFKTFKMPVLLAPSFTETTLRAYERLGLLSSSKPLESILIYSKLYSCLPFTFWTPAYDPLP